MAALAVVIGLVAAACDDGGSTSPTTTAPTSTSGSSPDDTTPDGGDPGTSTGGAGGETPRTFAVRLSEGEAPPTVPDETAVVDGDALSPEQVDAVTTRLPEFTDDGSDTAPFAWPIESRPPPRTGATVEVPFPATDGRAAPEVPTGPLQVLRVQPEGEVPIAPYVAITFDQPMVAVGTVAQVDAADVPASISPAIAGRWQWIGTRTLRFDASSDVVDRLPMATEFTVTIPAGTESATGGVLADDATFTFRTPAPSVLSYGPSEQSVRTDQVFVATFDQRVDPAAVLATVHLRAGDDEVRVRLATEAEVAADDAVRGLRDAAEDGRSIAFRPVDPLPTDTPLTVEIGPGTPSAEGPLTTDDAARWTARTYPPLRVQDHSCAYGSCWPGTPLTIDMNNLIDVDASDLDAITVSPDLPGMAVGVYGTTIQVQGATAADTEYEVTLPASLTDVYGQTLGDAETVRFRIDQGPPSLQQLDAVTTLDPFADEQRLTVVTTGHDQLRVRVYAADPARAAELLSWIQWRRDDPSATEPDLTLLDDRTVDVDTGGDDGATVEQPIDLAPYLNGAPGQVIVRVDPVPAVQPTSNEYWQNRPIVTWVQSTTLGVDALTDARGLTAWATDLRTGAPLDGVTVTYQGAGVAPATTDTDGLARLDLPATLGADVALVATRGDEAAVLPVTATSYVNGDTARWYVLTDRQIYRPGETVRLKGWVRRYTDSTTGELRPVADGATVAWSLSDAYGNSLGAGTLEVNALGGFDTEIAIPATADLGPTGINLQLNGDPSVVYGTTWQQIDIEQFRRPEFEVTTTPETQPPFLATAPVTVGATGSYYAGGVLPASPVDWQVSTSPATYSPPGWDGFTFGIFQPWWFDGPSGGYAGGWVDDVGPCCGPFAEPDVEQYQGTTDAAGTHHLRLDFEGDDGVLPDLPVTVSATATITDVDRQAWSSTSTILVHAADRYVGLESARPFVRQGDALDVQVVVTDVDGAAVPGVTVDVVAGLVEQRFVDGEWSEVVTGEQTCTVTSAADPVPCSFETRVGGEYRITSVVTDSHGGRNRSQLDVWVSGATAVPTRGVDQQALTLVPDAKEYAPGQTASVFVQAPFATGEGLMTVSRNGLRSTIRFAVADGTAIVPVPVGDDAVPQLTLGVEVVGSTERVADDGTPVDGAPPRPAFAVGQLVLSVPPVQRTLTVDVTPADPSVLPGADTSVGVAVRDASGAPVAGAEFAVAIVDEAVLDLTGFQLADPLGAFYGSSYESLQTWYARQQIRLTDAQRLATGDDSAGGATADTEAPAGTEAAGAAPATTAAASESGMAPADAPASDADRTAFGDGSGTPLDVRSNFDALALFEPTVVTGADGTASIPFTVPDTLTRYRVMVVAVSGTDRFGRGEADLTARLPLSVRPSAPRFANYGDSFELPVVVQNQGAEPVDVDVVVQASNLTVAGATDATPAAGKRVTVPAGDRVEVRFPMSTELAGTATVRVAAVSGDLADASTVTLPVYTPATAEAFATYGVIEDGAAATVVAQPVLAPTDVVPGFGGLEVSTSSTSLQALTDAVLQVTNYPYDSGDGSGARIITIASLRDVLSAFSSTQLSSADDLDAATVRDIARIVALQRGDGTFAQWPTAPEPDPFITVQATHALVVARDGGFDVPGDTYDRALAAVASIESIIPAWYPDEQRDAIRAYALWVRALAGQRDPDGAQDLYDERGDELGVDALAWIWGSIDDQGTRAEIGRTIGNRVVETAGTAHVTTDYGDGAWLIMQSEHRSDAIVLDALIDQQPDSDLIPKLVAGLLASSVQGAWSGIQENLFVLVALHRYFETYERTTPDFVARVWLGAQFAGEQAFQGRTTDRAAIDIPTDQLVAAGDTDLVLQKDGPGRLTYRIGLRYAPADLQLDPLDRGFTVVREYAGVDDPADVRRDPDGTWHVAAGARVKVTLTMVAESERAHVALIDPLAAGLESVNGSLAVSQPAPPDASDGSDGPIPYDSWWWGRWYEHEQLRDDRTEAFASYLAGGTYTYSYIARATTPGTFVVPPARAEEMYSPETFGRSSTDRLVVE